MDMDIIVAIIGASAVVVGALITGLFTLLKKDKTSETKIKSKQKGNSNTQIGIQNNYVGSSTDLDKTIKKKIEEYMNQHDAANDDTQETFKKDKSTNYHEKDSNTSGKTVYINCTPHANPRANVSSKNQSANYYSDAPMGTFTFDYSNNNGEYTIGTGIYKFITKWSKASDTCIHAYKDGLGIDSIARVKNIKQLPLELIGEYDFSSRIRTPNIGDMVIWKNSNGKYAATRIVSIADDTRGADHDELTCEYIIYTSKEYVDSDWIEEQLNNI